MKNTVFTGVATAIVTPLTKDGIDFEKFGELIEWQIAEGINAIVVCGTTGESSTLTDEEHKEAIKFAVEKIAGRVPVLCKHSAGLRQDINACSGRNIVQNDRLINCICHSCIHSYETLLCSLVVVWCYQKKRVCTNLAGIL